MIALFVTPEGVTTMVASREKARAYLTKSSRTNGLMSPPKNMKETLLNFGVGLSGP